MAYAGRGRTGSHTGSGMLDTVVVVVGAGIGGGFRHGVNVLFARWLPGFVFPVATLVINVLGSFLMGVLVAVFALKGGGTHPLRLFLTTGLLGGFTTFSTFSLDAVALYERGQWAAAAGYVAASVGASVAGLVGAFTLVRSLGTGAG